MIFQIKWGDMEKLLKRKFTQETENISPIFYFENESELTIYQSQGSYILCSSISKELIEDLIAFKKQYLMEAIELIEKPSEKTIFEINQR